MSWKALAFGVVKGFCRRIHLERPLYVEKSHLATLRKKTGYSLNNIKKALELHGMDLKQAEEWLHAQAQAEGWTKLSKVQGRATAHGLIGMKWKNNELAMIEINCETDFVSRNDHFQKFVVNCVEATWDQYKSASQQKVFLPGNEIGQLKTANKETLADMLAFTVNRLGENLQLKRGSYVQARNDQLLFGYVHPSGNKLNDVLLGRFAAWIILRRSKPMDQSSELEELGLQLCQHIIGMNPSKLGTDEDKPIKNKEEESIFIFQEFLSNPDVTVKELLIQNQLEIIDYQRFQCGELE